MSKENHFADYNCPECGKEYKVNFVFYLPHDKEKNYVDVPCNCGCVFTCECLISVKYNFNPSHPIIIKRSNHE